MKTQKNKIILTTLLIFISLLSCSTSSDSDPSSEDPTDPTDPEDPIETPIESALKFQKHFQTNDSTFILNSAVQLSDSSFTLGGAVRKNLSDNMNVLMKFDKYGNRKWTRVDPNSNSGNGIIRLFLDENDYIGLRGRGFSNDRETRIITYNELGYISNEILLEEEFSGNDMTITQNNFLVTGSTSEMNYRLINPSGDLIWETSHTITNNVYSVSQLSNGDFISIGGGSSTALENYLVKFNNSGEILWSKNHRGIKVLAIDNNEFLAATNDENLDEMNLVRFNSEGDTVWSKPLINFDTSTALNIINYDMNYFICSYLAQNNKLNILVLDQNGNEINLHTIDNGFVSYKSITKTIDNGLLITYSDYLSFDLVKLSSSDLFN